jgi:hypothetical protein
MLILRSSAPSAAEDYRIGRELAVGWDADAQQVIDAS